MTKRKDKPAPEGNESDAPKVLPEVSAESIIEAAEDETLSGDIRDALLTHVRGIKVPWTMLSEVEQQEHIDAIAQTARQCVRRTAGIIAQQGFPYVIGNVNKWLVKDGIKLELGMSALVENMHKLAQHGNKAAVLVLSDPEMYMGQRAAAVADKDQPDLPMNGDDDFGKDA